MLINYIKDLNKIKDLKENGFRNYYVGMTQRKFKVRCKEHIADIKFNRGKTVLSRLNQIENIDILFNESKLIYKSGVYLQLLIRESIEIYVRSSMVCNDSLSFQIPNIWIELLDNLKIK